MMPRGRLSASSALHSGTTRGTSSSMRNALELSIITAPCLVMSAANSFDVPAPAEVKAMSMSLKSSLCCSSFTSYSLPLKVYFVPADRFEPNNTKLSIGKFLSASTLRNSCPTAPLAPTIATFMFYFGFGCVCLKLKNLQKSWKLKPYALCRGGVRGGVRRKPRPAPTPPACARHAGRQPPTPLIFLTSLTSRKLFFACKSTTFNPNVVK